MEDATPPAGSSLDRNLWEAAIDLDLMDEMLSGNYWLEATDYSDVRQPGTSNSTSPFGFSVFSPFFESSNASPNQILPESDGQDEAQTENFERTLPLDPNLLQLGDFEVVTRSVDAGSSGWITPRISISSMKERLNHALMVIRESLRDSDVLVQIWVPVRMSGRRVLTTVGQPFWLNPSCHRLANYRSVSMKYQFSAEANSTEALGLPGRVFLGRVPEWTPDVRYFSSTEYPRVGHAQHFDVRGTLGLPIFEHDSCSCLGVVELVRTIQKINYSADLENICNALQVVDLRSSGVRGVPCVKMRNDSYLGALPEILEVLRTVCETHKLPLAQTWIPCIQQCKGGSRHSDENYKDCVSTVDSACYVKDPSMFSFHEACSEYHLLRGQGVAGKAFTTNQPCFSPDITSFSKIEYPLSHHARVFNLRAAVAIRLRSINTGNADFVLEFFLPINCVRDEEQKLLLNSLSNTIQHICRSLRVVTGRELEEEAMSLDNQLIPTDVLLDKSFVEDIQEPNSDNIPSVRPFQVGASEEASSWISNVIETQRKEGSSTLLSCDSLELNKPEIEEFSVTTHWGQQEVGLPVGKTFSEVKQQHHDYIEGTSDCRDSFTGDPGFLNTGKATEKRRTKTEKTVSLQVLRQYFAGSLKDAAKSLGVCPTTLKRICRLHGITRWPSRKIKKVGHSLKKLQVVIDSVRGAEGTFQFSSLYENFTKASGSGNLFSGSSTLSTLKQEEQLDTSKMQQQHEARISFHTSASNSLSSCSQTSSSSQCCSSGAKQGTQGAQLIVKQEIQPEENRTGTLKRAHSEVDIILSTQEAPISLTRSQSLEIVGEHHVSSSLSPSHKSRSGLLRIKATYGEEKVRFRLQPTWAFQDLRQEIGKRFNIGNISSMDLKYLDDDSEWVLMTCDADLQECIDVCKSSGAQTVKITVHPASQRSSGNTLGHSGLS